MIVVKAGGGTTLDVDAIVADIASLRAKGTELLLVHGGAQTTNAGRGGARTSARVRDERERARQPPHGPPHARDLRDGLLRPAEQDVGREAAARRRERRRPVGARRPRLRGRAQGHAAHPRGRPPDRAARRLDRHGRARQRRPPAPARRRRLFPGADAARRLDRRRGDQRRRRPRRGDGRRRVHGRGARDPERRARPAARLSRRIDAHHADPAREGRRVHGRSPKAA